MSNSKKPSRRPSKRQSRAAIPRTSVSPRTSGRPRASRGPEQGARATSARADENPLLARIKPQRQLPLEDSAVALLRAQLERAEDALQYEKDGRALDAASVGEMLARVTRSEERARMAEAAWEEARTQAHETRAEKAELETHTLSVGLELAGARTEIEAYAERLREAEARAAGNERTFRAKESSRPRAKGEADTDEVESLKTALAEARAEADRMRHSLEALRGRAGTIGAGLKEMRELMVQSAALFDDLEQREHAIADIRARSLREARSLFLRAAGPGAPRSSLPPTQKKPPMEDLSEAAELLEEEVRTASMRPPPTVRGGKDDES